MADAVSSQVYKSRDNIRNQIITLMRSYLELENVDLTKSSFLSFLVEILSTLTSNLLFYQISVYREFFLTQAQLPTSIFNLAAFLGYTPENATASSVDVLFTIPFGFEDASVEFTIPEGFQISSDGDINFQTYYTTTVTVTNNSSVSISIQEGNKIYSLPVETDASNFYFLLPMQNYEQEVQEFQIASDLQLYQFTSVEPSFDGQLSSVTVEVQPPNSSSRETYTAVNSLFLMEQSTKGYVARRTDTGLEIQFGNGLIGYQPEAGATVYVTLNLTDGADGNIIAGSVNTSQRIYNTTQAGVTQIVQYDVTNTSPASGGEDEESVEEVRRGAIANISALERIITENDFINANLIIDDSPIGQSSLPVLKRSDLKVNEITLFSLLLFASELVPTRDIKYDFSSTYVPRQTVLTEDGVDYYTVYDMTIDPLNSAASYTYVMYAIDETPTLVTSYGSSDYNFSSNNMTVSRSGSTATYTFDYISTESDADLLECEMEISDTNQTFTMTNDSTSSFVYTFSDTTIIPEGNLTYYFTISHPTEGLIAQYSTQFIYKLSLDDFTTSSVVSSDSTAYTVYDIPTVRKSYYDSIVAKDFEQQVMQQMLTTMSFKDYRMLTDFISFKFANTTGSLTNMQLNETTVNNVTDIRSTPPSSGTQGDRYIVLNGTGAWLNKDNYIASLSDATAMTWVFTLPDTEDIVYVTNKATKYIYCETGWRIPTYSIPLEVEVDVFKSSTYSGSIGDLAQAVRNALYNAFSSRFGIGVNLYRSELIDVVQGVTGVEHCVLIKPESSIFFEFDINDFTQEQLLSYAPEYVYFTTDDITVRVV